MIAAPAARTIATKAGSRKLSCLGSTAWRSGTPPAWRGKSSRKARKSSGSNRLVAMNRHKIGPSLSAVTASRSSRYLPVKAGGWHDRTL